MHRADAAVAACADRRAGRWRAWVVRGRSSRARPEPAGSPDIIGISAGAAGAVFVIVVLVAAPAMVPAGRSSARSRGRGDLFRRLRRGLRRTGWCSSASGRRDAHAVTNYLMTRAEIYDAQRATCGSPAAQRARVGARRSGRARWRRARPGGAGARPVSAGAATRRRRGQGARHPRGARPTCAHRSWPSPWPAVAAASAGPITFVAFVASPIARRLVRSPLTLVPSALWAHWWCSRPTSSPGACSHRPSSRSESSRASSARPYLLWLLARSNRTGREDEGATPWHRSIRRRRLGSSWTPPTLGYDQQVARTCRVDPPGRITCIVGANACGKSTLLRALARLLRPQRGQRLLDGGDPRAADTGVAIARHPAPVAGRARRHHVADLVSPAGTRTKLAPAVEGATRRRSPAMASPARWTWPRGSSTSCRAASASGRGSR